MIFNKLEKRETSSNNNEGFDWSSWIKGDDYTPTNALNEQNYLNALNVFSETIAQMPIIIKQVTDKGEIEARDHYLWDILRLRPNGNMNASEVKKALIMMYKHYGLDGLFIDRGYKGKVKGLYPVRIDGITVDDAGLIKSTMNNKVLVDFTLLSEGQGSYQGTCFDKDIIILRDNSLDGMHGKASRRYGKQAIDTNLKAQSYQNDLFSNGLTNKAVVQMTSGIKKEEDITIIQNMFNEAWKRSKQGRILTIPAGYNLSPLNLSLADSQFAELKISGKKDIASMVGVPFSLLDTGTLDDTERVNFLTFKIQPILTTLEQELDWKLLSDDDRRKGYKIRFNVNTLLRTSPEQQKNIACDYVKNGIWSLEYARKEIGVESDFENETVILPAGEILLKDLLSGKASWQNGKYRYNNSDVERGVKDDYK